MPYIIRGNIVLKKSGGKWKKKAKAKSPASAKRMVRLLHGVDRGWKPSK